MKLKDHEENGFRSFSGFLRSPLVLIVCLAIVAFSAFWCQVREGPATRQLQEYQRDSETVHGYGQLRLPTRRMGDVGSFERERALLDAVNSTSIPRWCPADMPLLAVTCSTNEPLPRILQWIRYHQRIGFSLFYFFVEGKANEPEVVDALRALVGVKVFLPDDKLKWWHVRDRSHHEHWLKKFFGQPCNGELFVKQSINMAVAVHQARVDGAAWIGHIDTDELAYPASSADFSMHQVLEHVPADFHSMILPNYEALPERGDVVDPSREVTLFKVAVDHIDRVAMQQHYKAIAHGNPNYFIAYSNGKSLAKVLPGLRPHGAHRWSSYNGSHQPWTHPQAAVLHYTYNRISDLLGRRDRCECAPTEADAKRCFWLSFDQEAFVAASLKTDDELHTMFHDRLVWDKPADISTLRAKGLLTRIYGPQLIIRQEAPRLAQSIPRRSEERQAHDRQRRSQHLTTTMPFAFAEDTPEGPPATCEEFLAGDSSLNILELMGPLPGPDDVRDSDEVLISRMTHYEAAGGQGPTRMQSPGQFRYGHQHLHPPPR